MTAFDRTLFRVTSRPAMGAREAATGWMIQGGAEAPPAGEGMERATMMS